MHGTNSVNHNEAPQNCLKTVTILLVCGIELVTLDILFIVSLLQINAYDATQITELLEY